MPSSYSLCSFLETAQLLKESFEASGEHWGWLTWNSAGAKATLL